MPEINTILIGQAGGPTPVINNQLAGALYEAQRAEIRVFGSRNGMQGVLDADLERIIDISHWNPDDVMQPPGSVLGATRLKLNPTENGREIEMIRETLENLGVDSVIYFGGNDTSYTLQSLGFGVHGSKTVDNDLPGAHHTSGFGSAALSNATWIKNLQYDIGSYRAYGRLRNGESGRVIAPVLIYQTMGRNTGWLALATAFARSNQDGILDPEAPPHIIWPREILFDENRYLEAVDEAIKKHGMAVVAIGEELLDSNGKPLADVYESEPTDEHGNTHHSGVDSFNYAQFLGRVTVQLNQGNHTRVKVTPIVPQHVQRVGIVSQTDADEAFEVGRETVRAILDGQELISIVLQKDEGEPYRKLQAARIPIEVIAGKTRHVPDHYIDGIRGPTGLFVSELLPTIGGPDALPHYPGLDFSKTVKLN